MGEKERTLDELAMACGLSGLGEDAAPPDAVEATVANVAGLRASGDLSGTEEEALGREARRVWAEAGQDGEELWAQTAPDDDGADDPNQKQLLVHIAGEKVGLFTDQRERAYARVRQEGHHELWPLRSRRFKSFLAREFYKETGNVPASSVLTDALNVLFGQAVFDGPTRELANRFCWHDGDLWYDLGDEEWRAVRVTDAGWQVVADPPPLFRRYGHQEPQVAPVKGGELPDLLAPFLNVSSDEALLLVLVWLVAALLPNVARTVLILWGPQGSAKTTAAKLFRLIVDPSAVPMPRTPRNDKELAQALDHHAAPFFDNLSFIDNRTSDTLCRAVTGDGFTKRQLYTDDEDILYQFQRVLLLNGINVPAQRPDLLDRSILVHLDRISKESRLEERELWKEFERVRARVFGAVLSTLSGAMRRVQNVELDELPRMADWTRWGVAITEELGFDRETFLGAYAANRRDHHAEALTSHPVGAALTAFMQDREYWEGASSDLLRQLEKVATAERIDTRHDLWPGSAAWLTRRIREVETNLNARGVQFAQGRTEDVRIIRLWKEGTHPEGPGAEQEDLGLHTEGKKDSVRSVSSVREAVHGTSSADAIPDATLTPSSDRGPAEADADAVVRTASGVASASEPAVHAEADATDATDAVPRTSFARAPLRPRRKTSLEDVQVEQHLESSSSGGLNVEPNENGGPTLADEPFGRPSDADDVFTARLA